jgi:predicted RNase H-like HicB family nuclease
MKKAGSKKTKTDWAPSPEAMKIASEYRVQISKHPSHRAGAGFVGRSVEMPLVFGKGDTASACFESTLHALAATVQTMLDDGLKPPTPAAEGKREVQLNIRLTTDERVRIEEQARQAGFRSISDYIRRAALRGTG